jgi:hypothetical protein
VRRTLIGIDVAKAELVVAARPSGERWTVVNDERGVRTLVERLRSEATPSSRESLRMVFLHNSSRSMWVTLIWKPHYAVRIFSPSTFVHWSQAAVQAFHRMQVWQTPMRGGL